MYFLAFETENNSDLECDHLSDSVNCCFRGVFIPHLDSFELQNGVLQSTDGRFVLLVFVHE